MFTKSQYKSAVVITLIIIAGVGYYTIQKQKRFELYDKRYKNLIQVRNNMLKNFNLPKDVQVNSSKYSFSGNCNYLRGEMYFSVPVDKHSTAQQICKTVESRFIKNNMQHTNRLSCRKISRSKNNNSYYFHALSWYPPREQRRNGEPYQTLSNDVRFYKAPQSKTMSIAIEYRLNWDSEALKKDWEEVVEKDNPSFCQYALHVDEVKNTIAVPGNTFPPTYEVIIP